MKSWARKFTIILWVQAIVTITCVEVGTSPFLLRIGECISPHKYLISPSVYFPFSDRWATYIQNRKVRQIPATVTSDNVLPLYSATPLPPTTTSLKLANLNIFLAGLRSVRLTTTIVLHGRASTN